MNETLRQALCACFGLGPSSQEASALILEAYQEPEPAPRPPRTVDVIYYHAAPDPSAQEPPPAYSHESAPSALSPTVTAFRAWQLHIVCYGPRAADNARRIRAFLFLDGAGMPRAILRKSGIYPLPNPPEPTLLHEPEGSLWRARADLTVSLRAAESLTHPSPVGAITIAPEVRVIPNA